MPCERLNLNGRLFSIQLKYINTEQEYKDTLKKKKHAQCKQE